MERRGKCWYFFVGVSKICQMLVDVGRGESFATEAGLSGGGEALPRIYASMCFAYCLARPATSERGAADLSRLRRVPAAEIETKSCGCVGVWVYAYAKMHYF